MSLTYEIGVRVKVALQRVMNIFRAPRVVTAEAMQQYLASNRGVVDQFSILWYEAIKPGDVRWRGHELLKSPFDLWIYQEILFEQKPDVIIETGTHRGGSALFLADMAKMMGLELDIITIDFNAKLAYDPAAHRIHPIAAISTTSAATSAVAKILEDAKKRLGRAPKVMVTLDSDHSKANVVAELEAYAPLVTSGQYLVVEDTNINGHPVLPEHGPGPWEAVQDFLAAHHDFTPDARAERYLFTNHPHGWLRKQ
ncbi:MAG: class I SAM-dependent methyltransferase [Acidobacteria bacterium]|nr:class I SAM-dependent methyltransferase [Acidobacteriota bacterium]